MSQEKSHNPLLDKLTPSQFQHTVEFYEADQKLSSEDRDAVANDLMKRTRKATLGSFGVSTFMVTVPTIYASLKKIPPFNTSSIPSRMYKPFWSFMLSLGSLLVSNQQLCKYQFNEQIKELEDKGTTKEKELAVWRSMDYHQAGIFLLYYRKTAIDPSYILKDPRTFTEKSLHEVRYHPSKTLQGHAHQKTKWDDIRQANGFSEQQPVASQQFEEDVGPETSEVENDNEKQQTPSSAWDNIRSSKR